ncbi:BA14K family protein [Bradyrhizobium manausense]|uniref:BA14K family protein n=1 Tax=Bradyrhizobium manausense TaxID=989370 RepID=UPI001BA4FB11|nr:BA14K family protein [Bradyrhizobium manausense]MBR0831682.1 BA14K family protein [Bradyrhizobium manausense]
MNNLRVLSAAAALALVLPMAPPSFAQGPGGHGGGGGGAHFAGGGGGAHIGGGGGGHVGGGGFAAGAMARPSAGPAFSGGGGNFAAGPAMRPSGGATFSGGTRTFAATGGTWNGGGGNWHGGWHHRHGGFWPGFAAGAAIGGLGSYAYYGGPYYGDSYYDDGYYDDGATVAAVPDIGGDSSAYCAQRYRSYDPASGTYLGYDGLRHPCP